MELLIILATIYLANKVSIAIYGYAVILSNKLRHYKLLKQLKANHPEMKGVAIDNADLLFFGTDREFKAIIMNNNEPADNTTIEDSDKFVIAVDEYDRDDEDDD